MSKVRLPICLGDDAREDLQALVEATGKTIEGYAAIGRVDLVQSAVVNNELARKLLDRDGTSIEIEQ